MTFFIETPEFSFSYVNSIYKIFSIVSTESSRKINDLY